MAALMELRNVYKIYRTGAQEVHALDGVSLSFAEGEFAAIVGRSGSGKSTLMNCLGCLDRPSAGSYCFRGDDVAQLSERRRARLRNRAIGFVFQSFNLLPELSALENVALPLVYRGVAAPEREDRARRALAQVGLSARALHRPHELSGGQQQRVAIARVLAADPDVLLADEPTGNLDSAAGAEIVRLLHALHDAGRTIILITHDPRVAAAAPRCIELRDGRVIADSGAP